MEKNTILRLKIQYTRKKDGENDNILRPICCIVIDLPVGQPVYIAFIFLCEMKMGIKKVTYEEALARIKRSLEIRRNAKRRMADEWEKMGLKGTVESL